MGRWPDDGAGRVGKDVRPDEGGQVFIEMRHVGKSSAENYNIRIDDVDDHGETSCQAAGVAIQGLLGLRVASARKLDDGVGFFTGARCLVKIIFERRAGNPGLKTSLPAAPAGRSRILIGLGPG